MAYRAQYLVTIDYDHSDNSEASNITHTDFLASVLFRIREAKQVINRAEYKFAIKEIKIDKPY